MNNNTQNMKIATIKEKTLVVGVDIGSETHYARAFDWRGYEFSSKKAFKFSNSREGFDAFKGWVTEMMEKHDKDSVIVGMEPTGHYWICLGKYLQDNEFTIAHVNPHHVKKTKELDDNSQTKNDRKDPKVIAGLVNEGRFSYPYLPDGIYAELRNASNLRFQAQGELTRVKNRMARWVSIYFPEYKDVYGEIDAVSGLMVLVAAPLPEDILSLGPDGVNKIWREARLRGVGMKRANMLVDAAAASVGVKESPAMARMEIRALVDDYKTFSSREEELMAVMEGLLGDIPYVDKLLSIKGIGVRTAAGFIAEVGDIRRFDSPKQLQKLAGYALAENSSGKHKGETKISRRGRKRLRYLLYLAALSVVGKNSEFKKIHGYYTSREVNPLKKMQSLIAVACKLTRVFYAILKKGVDYDPGKMMSDIRHTEKGKDAA